MESIYGKHSLKLGSRLKKYGETQIRALKDNYKTILLFIILIILDL
jgi:hypothetical protein